MALKNQIRRLRFEHNELSQAALAEAIGVSRQTIISIEKGNYTPSVLLALKFAEFFKVEVEQCFYLEKKEV